VDRARGGTAARLARSRLFERLVSALSIVIGWEAFIVLSDVRGLDHTEQVQVAGWAARAIVRAAIHEANRSRGRSRLHSCGS
jgi:hypothetical protein